MRGARTMKDTAAIIVAGGKGLRYGGPVRKQYLPLGGRPIVWWSLSAFERSPSIFSIVLVVPAGDVAKIRARTPGWKFKKLSAVVAGGRTRADSVRRGLSATPRSARYVAVHDAVRPLVRPKLIESVIDTARKAGAALAACPSKDTVKLANSRGLVIASPPRDTVWLAQTPQIFERRLLERAHRLRRNKGRGSWSVDRRSKSVHGARCTDDSQLVERLGVRVKLVESPPDNIKVTLPMDFVLARSILKGRK